MLRRCRAVEPSAVLSFVQAQRPHERGRAIECHSTAAARVHFCTGAEEEHSGRWLFPRGRGCKLVAATPNSRPRLPTITSTPKEGAMCAERYKRVSCPGVAAELAARMSGTDTRDQRVSPFAGRNRLLTQSTLPLSKVKKVKNMKKVKKSYKDRTGSTHLEVLAIQPASLRARSSSTARWAASRKREFLVCAITFNVHTICLD